MEGLQTIFKLLEIGGPYAMAALAIMAAIWKNRECGKLNEQVLKLVEAQTTAANQVANALNNVKTVVDKYESKNEKSGTSITKIEIFMEDLRKKLEKIEDLLRK